MLTIFVIAAFAFLAGLTAFRFFRMNIKHLCFADGLLVATVYYIAVPLLLIMISGYYQSPDVPDAIAYYPFQDIATTLNLELGWFLVLMLQTSWHKLYDRQIERRWEKNHALRSNKRDFYLMLALLLGFSLFTFVSSGRTSGGHWQENMGNALNSNFMLIILANFYNAYRAMIFSMLVYLNEAKKLSIKSTTVIGLLIVVTDIMLSFNRITAAYYIITLLIIYRRHMLLFLLALIPLLSTAAYVSKLWAIIRGLALVRGYSIESFTYAINLSLGSSGAHATNETIAVKSNGIFETSNLQVYHNVITMVPKEMPILWGQTYFLRPLAIYIPVALWPDKPISFNVQLGSYIAHINGLALNCTFLGEPYGNFMYLWPFAFMFMMLLSCYIFRWLSRLNAYFGFWGFFAAFAFARFDMGFVMICAVSIIFFYAVTLGLRYLRQWARQSAAVSRAS